MMEAVSFATCLGKTALGGKTMLFSESVPFIRFAEIIHFESAGAAVYVQDCRIFYTLSGSARIYIDGQEYAFAPNTVFYCCGGSQYTICAEDVDLIAVNFDLDQVHRDRKWAYSPVRLSAAATLPPANHCFIEDQDILNQHIFLKNGLACRELLEEILDEFSTRRILYLETASSLLKELLVRLLRGSIETASQGATAVEKIIGHIRTHYNQPMTNASFSQLFGYHEYYLNRLFTMYTGSTIHQYILDVRISHAKKLLLNTDLPLAAIAEKVGFNSNTYFSSYFRQTTGISPSQFRKINKNSI